LKSLSHFNVSATLVRWYKKNQRTLPWRDTKNPYIIWLSEIILQQTRVEQGLPYFQRFAERFQDVESLAKASENEILKLWQGLGYYSRARNLHEAAKTIVSEHKGVFPDRYIAIRNLKGVGDYTAAAISSFAFNQPFAVVDGNVYRFLSRYFGVSTPIDSSKGKKQFAALADEILDKKNPGMHNQAIMEYGSMVCKPASPDCLNCAFRLSCVAFKENKVDRYPVKEKKTKIRNRYFNYLMVRYQSQTYVRQRPKGDIWSRLYEFPLIETDSPVSHHQLIGTKQWKALIAAQKFQMKTIKEYPVHKLSHQHIHTRVVEINMKSIPKQLLTNSFIEIDESDVRNYPVSRLMETIISEHLPEWKSNT